MPKAPLGLFLDLGICMASCAYTCMCVCLFLSLFALFVPFAMLKISFFVFRRVSKERKVFLEHVKVIVL